MNIAIYSRKSVETDTGESIKNQINLCKEYFGKRYNNCTFTVFEDEGFSGSNIKRPGFMCMMNYAKLKSFEIVAVYKIDRIARNIVDFVNIYDILEKYSIKLVSITEGFDPSTPAGKMLMLMLASFAEMERMNISQRVTDNMQELAKLGRWSGGKIPFGYKSFTRIEQGKKAVYLELLNSEESTIKGIFQMYTENRSANYISNCLKASGYNLSSNAILDIIRNPTYLQSSSEACDYLKSIGYTVYGVPNNYGFLPYNRKPNKNNRNKASTAFVAVSVHKPVVNLSIWKKANELLTKKSTFPHTKETSRSFLSNGIIRCKRCNISMKICSGHKRKDGSRLYYFRCPLCHTGFLRVDSVEHAMLDFFKSLLDKNILHCFAGQFNSDYFYYKKANELNKKINFNKVSIDNLIYNLCSIQSTNSSKIISEKIDALSKKNNTLKYELSVIKDQILISKNSNPETFYNNISDWIVDCNVYTKKKLVTSVIDYILYDTEKNQICIKLIDS